MNETEGLRQRRPLRPQVITEDSPAQQDKEGRWGLAPSPAMGREEAPAVTAELGLGLA